MNFSTAVKFNQILTKSSVLNRLLSYRNNCVRYFKSGVVFRQQQHSARQLPFEVNTNIPKDVLLFKYENDRLYRLLNIFALSQFIFWIYLSEFSYSTLRDISVEEAERRLKASLPPEVAATQKLVWWRRINLGQNKYRYGISFMCLVLGVGIMVIITAATRRSVKYLTLLKGGEKVRLECYSPFWLPARRITTSVEKLNCQTARSPSSSLPIRIKGYRMYFLLDKNGHYTNTKLFDMTTGLKRSWN